ncbi:MAG: type IV pilus secretin PilQ [Nitrospirota bacterium]|nr:type IV pilus secretin PilQ [Nitrospirota bacterium]
MTSWASRVFTGAACALFVAAFPALAAADVLEIKQDRKQFSLEFREAELKDVLRAVGQAAGLNLIVGEAVSGRVTMSLGDVDIWAALEAILKTKGLTYVREGDIVRVLSVNEARDEDMETRVFSLANANGKEVIEVLEKVKSDKARLSADPRMNAVVVRDLSLNLDRMERVLKQLDIRVPQILIEAKIVEMSSSYARELGIQWGGKYAGASDGNTVGVSGGTTGVSGAGASGAAASLPLIGSTSQYPLTGNIGMSGNAYVVNLPAAVGAGSGGALGITFGKAGGRLNLDLQLSAMQTMGNGRILSSPKVLTRNNKEAKISSGIDIPVRVLTTTTAGTTSDLKIISASLALSTIAVLTTDNRISLSMKLEKSEPDFSRQVDNIPTITKRSAAAELIVDDGETAVLGGILTKSEGRSESGVPFLSDLPLIGWLFKKKSKYENETELMIFITPTIIKDEQGAAAGR